MSEFFFCDFCLFPDPGKECPMHGPAAMKRLNDGLRHLIEEQLADLGGEARHTDPS